MKPNRTSNTSKTSINNDVIHSQRSAPSKNHLSPARGGQDDPPGVPFALHTRVTTDNTPTKNHVKMKPGSNRPNKPCPPCSVKVIDSEENVLFEDAETFAWNLGCPADRTVKVIAILGSTGDGKSYTMNHTFCGGEEVFITSSSQRTCTIGVWAAFLPDEGYLLIDTEGLLGSTSNPNRQRRLLLKVFALADVVIYRTVSDRMHSDMFTFLADASDAFVEHFRPDLEALAQRTGLPWSAGQLGPAVIVFQDTRYTTPLDDTSTYQAILDNSVCPNDGDASSGGLDVNCKSTSSVFLFERLRLMQRNVNAFSSLEYIGTQTKSGPTDFEPLAILVAKLTQDNSVRMPRRLTHIFTNLQALNSRFSSDIPPTSSTFIEEYFTCPVRCLSCSARCRLGLSHLADDQPHVAVPPSSQAVQQSSPGSKNVAGLSDGNSKGECCCQYDQCLQNKLYYCKRCYAAGRKTMMVPKSGDSTVGALTAVIKYMWSGYVLECPRHGVVFRSRAQWSGNPEPEDAAGIHWEVVHVWPGEKSILQGTHPVGQLVLDGLSAVSSQVSQIAGPPARKLGDLITDSVAPEYWQPNSTITACAVCGIEFPQSEVDRNVPGLMDKHNQRPRHLSDGERSTASSASGGPPPNRPVSMCGDSPSTNSSSSPTRLDQVHVDVFKHHCRACGRGVCGACSTARLPVPDRGFGMDPVRVCSQCFKERGRAASIKRHPRQKFDSSNDETEDMNLQTSSVINGRKVIEMLSATANYITPIYSGPKDLVKSWARPDYWEADESATACAVCETPFNPIRCIHHCRSCGRCVCASCSQHSQPVPKRGIDFAVRVCNACCLSSSKPRL